MDINRLHASVSELQQTLPLIHSVNINQGLPSSRCGDMKTCSLPWEFWEEESSGWKEKQITDVVSVMLFPRCC
jgi:hypothetical protein